MNIVAKVALPLGLATVSSCLLAAAVEAADPEAIAAAVDAAFEPLLAEHGVPGIAVAVTVDGERHFFSYGLASRESGAPVTQDTLFEIGSISKTFTATLGAYAQELGRMSIEDHPSAYMPELADSPIDEATLLNLATYTAGGLPLQFPNGVVGTSAGALDYFTQWRPDAAPGEQRRYSNPSIGLFGYLAALAMEEDFAELMEGEIFPKLGLEKSYIRVPEAAMADYAWGYNRDDQPARVNFGLFGAEAYGVRATAADMIRFVEANIAPETLEPEMQRAVEATHVGYFEVGEMVQGLGWEQYPYPVTLERLLAGNSATMAMEPNAASALTPPRAPEGPALFNKTGSTNGFGAYVAFVPEEGIGVVMLANRNFPIPARVTAAHAVLEALAE